MMRVKAVIFDMDGTLIDTSEAHIKAWLEASRSIGIRGLKADDVRCHLGKTSLAIAKGLLRHVGVSEDLAERFAELKDKLFLKKYVYMVPPFPHSAITLSSLKAQGIKVAVVSSNPSQLIKEVLRSTGLLKYVDVIVGQDEVREGKPSPEPILKALSKLGVGKGEALVVGDSRYDMIAAKRAGVRAYGVLTGVDTADELLKAGAQKVLPTLRDLLDDIA